MAEDYAEQIRAIVADLKNSSEKTVIKITTDVAANLVEATPVDIGWARANWVPAISAPYTADLSDVKPTSSTVSTASGAQSRGLSEVITGYTLDRGKTFVSNNVPYITRLNDGSSQQEPAGFVQRAVNTAVRVQLRGLIR